MTSDTPCRATLYLSLYNQEAYAADALRSALANAGPGVELLVSDDCSRDGTVAVLRQVLAEADADPCQIVLNANPENLGIIRHLNQAMTMARGEIVVNCAGDDISLPHRVEKILEAFDASGGQAMLIHSQVVEMSPDGQDGRLAEAPMSIKHFTLEDLARRFTAYQGCSGAWNRKLFDVFGPMTYFNTYEDVVIAFRAALLGEIVYLREPLVRYRVMTGISFAGLDRRHDVREMLRRDTRLLTLGIDTLRQRLVDLDKVSVTPELARLRRLMLADLRYYLAAQAFRAGGFMGLFAVEHNPFTVMVVVAKQLANLAKLHLKARRFR